jgi:hypothetical protein
MNKKRIKMIGAKNKKLEKVKKLVKEIHELDVKLDTARLADQKDDDGRYVNVLLNIIEEEYNVVILSIIEEEYRDLVKE